MILAKIRRDAESYLGEPVTEASSPCPLILTTASARPRRMPAALRG